MWSEISKELKGKIPDEWLEPIKEEYYVDSKLGKFLVLAVPNDYYLNRFKTEYKSKIQEAIKLKFNESVEIQFQIVSTVLTAKENLTEKPKPKTQLMKKNSFNGSPHFRNQEEINSYLEVSELQKLPKKIIELMPMPNKYSIENVATFSLFDSKFFTYPNDKRKKVRTEIRIKLSDGTVKVCKLFRGQFTSNDKGYGQLTTTHAKILLAIIHLWQYQGCQYADNKGYFSVVNISIRVLAKQLGYQKVSGSDYQRLLRRIKELTDFPNMLDNDNGGTSFTFLSDITRFRIKKDKNKLMLRLTFSPFVSKQLYERKAVLRNPECYKIKNPTAFKFLMCYDKQIFKGNRLKLEIRELAKELEFITEKLSRLVSILKTAIRELNEYELNDQYRLKAELIKENNQWYVLAERTLKEGEAVKQLIQSIAQPQKNVGN